MTSATGDDGIRTTPCFLLGLMLLIAGAAGTSAPSAVGQTTQNTTLPAQLEPAFLGTEERNGNGSVIVPLDSWIYPAFERLFALGSIDSPYLGLRPWTRLRCLHILEAAYPTLQDAPSGAEAWPIFLALAEEFGYEYGAPAVSARIDDVYSRTMYIAGPPINDSYHFGQTLINDYGRPYQEGFNAISGFTGRAAYHRLTLNVRGEYQHAPGRAAYPNSVIAIIAEMDAIPALPPAPVPTTNVFRLLDANLAFQVANHEISVGKSEEWWGPGQSGSMALSNNAEPIYAFRINRVEPLHIPLLSKLTGPFRYEALLGSLKGHRYPNAPWVHAEKVSFTPTRNLELGFSRVVIFAGEGHVPFTFGSFWNSFTSFSNVPTAQKLSRNDPGARFSSFDFTYRLPLLRKWATLYSDSIVHDDTSPVDAPRRAAINPGIYLSHFPKLPHLDLRAEAVSTDPPVRSSHNGQFMYYEGQYRDGYTNKGNLLGSWIGREGKGGQVWITYWLGPREYLQAGYRNAKVAKDFVPGGTTQNDFNGTVVLRLRSDLALKIFCQAEYWRVPVLAAGLQKDFTASVQITYFPKLKWQR